MRLKIMVPFVVIAVAVVLALSAASQAAPNAAAKTAIAAAAQPNAASAVPEPHPEIREAIEALRRAKDHMEHAAHDFGGHRVAALKATDDAIRQLELALKFDKD